MESRNPALAQGGNDGGLASAIKDKRICWEVDADVQGSTNGTADPASKVKMEMYAQFGPDGTVHMGPYNDGKAFDASKGTYKVDGLIVKMSMDGQGEGSLTFTKAEVATGDILEMKEVGKVTISKIEDAGKLEEMKDGPAPNQ